MCVHVSVCVYMCVCVCVRVHVCVCVCTCPSALLYAYNHGSASCYTCILLNVHVLYVCIICCRIFSNDANGRMEGGMYTVHMDY